VLAAASVYFFPSNQGTNVAPSLSTMTGTTQSFLSSTTVPMIFTSASSYYAIGSTTSVMIPNVTTISSPPSVGNATTEGSPPQWDAGLAVNLTLYSPVVLSLIRNAYSYAVDCCTSSSSSLNGESSIYMTIYVTESQGVSGNWTSGYLVTDSGIETINVTARFTEPASYQLASVNATALPERSYSITYTPLQQEIIGAALANSTVNGYIISDGLSPYYIGNVTAFYAGNATYGGDYFLTFLQADGPRFIGVFVNSTTMQVVRVYEDSMAASMCYYPSGVCFSSPWGSLAEQSTNTANTSVTTITTNSTWDIYS